METALERFFRYSKVYTTSDENSGVFPSSERQLDLARLLISELCKLNLTDIHIDACGNVIATLPGNVGKKTPVLALIAHMDTSPDAPGENVAARIVRYEGGELRLNDSVSLNEKLCPGIEKQVGEELIVPTASLVKSISRCSTVLAPTNPIIGRASSPRSPA